MAVIEWQAQLFDGADVAAEPRRTELAGGAWVDHAPRWLAGADDLFAELVQRAPWGQRRRRMYEGMVDEPRLTAWHPLDGTDTWIPDRVREIATWLSARYGLDFNRVGCNLYRDGRDSVAWHGDNVRKEMAEPLVAIVSLGQPRRFLLRPRGGGRSLRFDLGGGDLLVMGGTCQHTWEHCVPKVAAAGPRLSVTFRHPPPARDGTA